MVWFFKFFKKSTEKLTLICYIKSVLYKKGIIMLSKKVRGAVDKEVEYRQKNGVYGLFMMFVGAVIAVIIGVFLYLSPFFNKKTSPPLNQPVEVVPTTTASAESAPEEGYRFYEILPKQEFQTAPEGVSMQAVKPQPTTDLPVDEVVEMTVVEEEGSYDDGEDEAEMSIEFAEPEITYILQIRTYDNATEADQKRAEVMMAGIDAQVIKRYANDEVAYQVVSVPMASQEEAIRAYTRLQSNGIDAVVVEQKH